MPSSGATTNPMLDSIDRGRPLTSTSCSMTDAQAPEHLLGVGDVGEDEPELVAAQPGHGVLGPDVVGQALGQAGEELVAVVVPERVVDLLEAVEVDDGQRRPGVAADGAGHGLMGALVEQRPVGQVGEGVVLGQELVHANLLAQPAADRHGDHEERQVQRRRDRSTRSRYRAWSPARHVGVDRGVGQVDLEHADAVLGRAGRERQVHLDRFRPDRPRVVGVRVQVGQTGADLTVGGVERLVLGLAARTPSRRRRTRRFPAGPGGAGAARCGRPRPGRRAGAWRTAPRATASGLRGRPSSTGSTAVSATSIASARPSATPRCWASAR